MAETVLAISLGLGLSAACGFRVFVPMLVIGLAGQAEYLTLADEFLWITSTPAVIVFGLATLFEIVGHYIPWFDNLLSTIATPAAVVAGAVVSAAVIQDMSPFLKWTLAIIAGGGTAGLINTGFTGLRLTTTATTGGVANPIVATIEWIGSVLMSILAIFVPILAGLIALAVLVVCFLIARRLWSEWRRRRAAVEPTP